MTTPARDSVRSNYARMKAAVEPSRKVCCVCGVVLVEGTEPTSHGLCREDEVAMYADLAGRVPTSIPPRSRPIVARVMRDAYRESLQWSMSRKRARSLAKGIRHAATIAAIDAAERVRNRMGVN